MKFVLLTVDYPPARGGIATYYEGLVSALREAGHEVEVVTQGLVSLWVTPKWAVSFLTLWNIIKKNKPDFFIVGQVLPLGAAPYFFRKRVPYLVSAHGMDLTMATKRLRKKFLAGKILQNAHRVIANSQFTADLAKQFGVKDHSILILNPCPKQLPGASKAGIEALRSTLSLSGKKVVVSVGRLVERKGFDTVIESWEEVLKKIPQAVLVIAGDGVMRERLGKLAASVGVTGSVRILGAISDEELSGLYSLAHLFAMPCRTIGADVEGFGTVYLEAGLFGVPSVAGKSGGAQEAVIHQKTGLVVDPEAPSVAAAITSLLLDDETRVRYGEAAKEYADSFTWKNNVRELMKVV